MKRRPEYQFIKHNFATFDEQNKMFPSERIVESDGVYIQKNFIPWDHESVTVVFFVDGANGDSYGQFPTLEKACVKFAEVLSLPKTERRKLDV